MPSPSFLTKAFIAGFLFGHLFLPAEKSWLFKLARSSAFEVPLRSLSHLNTTSAGNGPQQAQGTDSLRYLVNDSTPVLSHPLLRNPTVSSNLTTNRHLTPTQIPTNQPTLSREISTLVLPNSSDPVTYRPSPTRATVSTTLYYLYGLPSASAQPPIPVVIPPRQPTGLGSSLQFRLTFHMLLCISILLYHTILFIYRKWKPRCKAHKLPERAVSMIIANLQDPQSLRACSLVSRSWAKESRRHLFHTISLDSKQSADLWFSPDTHGLTSHVRSIRLSVEAIAGAEHGLSRFLSVKTLRILDWRGTQSSLPTGWSSLTRTVDRLELVRPGGTTYEILTFVSLFKSLESLYITRTNQQSRCEVRATRVGDPETLSIRFRMLRHPSTNGISPTRSCSGNGISVRLHFDPQDIDEPLTVFLGCPNGQATRSCKRCSTGRSLGYPLARLVHPRSGRTLSVLRINTLPEKMIGMIDSLLISLPCISPQLTKITIEQFGNVDTIPVDKILPKFRSLGGVVEVGEQRIRI